MPNNAGAFFGDNWPFLLAAINTLILVCTALVGWIVRRESKFQEERQGLHNRWQREQDTRIGKLEDSMNDISGEQGIARTERTNIVKTLEEAVTRFERALERHEEKQDKDFLEVKSLIRQQHANEALP